MKSYLMLALAACCGGAYAQTAGYYVTQGTSGAGNTYVLLGGAQVDSYAWAHDAEMPIVIGDFGSGMRVRQAAGQPASGQPQPGDEYELDGTPTGFQNMWDSGDPAGVTAYDAAFDGTNIYMVHWGGATDGQVWRYDNNYANGQFLFNAIGGDLGITYDSGNNTIWTTNFGSGAVTEYSLGGVVVSSFNTGTGSVAALAYDAGSDSLWMALNDRGLIAEYDKQGNSITSYQAPNYVLGGEIAGVPEPATVASIALGLAALCFRRKRSR